MYIKILDCTLRDGAHVNKGEFGIEVKNNILKALIKSEIDIVEVGFLQKSIYSKSSTFYPNIESFIAENVTQNLREKCISFLVRTGSFDVEKIKNFSQSTIIRIAFRREEYQSALSDVRKLEALGIKTYMNPIGISSLSQDFIVKIIEDVSNLNIMGLSIVDTFGALTFSRFKSLFDLYNNLLPENMEVGVHLHENLCKSSAMIYYSIEEAIRNNRSLILDGSINGIGRDPGNIPTEILMQILKEFGFEKYQIFELFEIMTKDIASIKKNFEWGYDPYFFMSAFLNVDRTYGEYIKYNDGFDKIKFLEKICSDPKAASTYSMDNVKKALDELK